MSTTVDPARLGDPEIDALAGAYGRDPEAILPILRALQARRGTLTPEAIAAVAAALQIPPARAYGVASFYALLHTGSAPRPSIRLCDGPVCWLRGATQVRAALEGACPTPGAIGRTSCLGLCDCAPAALAGMQQCGPVSAEQIHDLLSAADGSTAQTFAAPTYVQPRVGEKRVLLARAGVVDPDSIDSALAQGSYRVLADALKHPRECVIAEIEEAGLRGRGGAGFPTGRKLRMVASAAPETAPRYVVCNADESEPLVFKDRVLIDADPHLLLEGIGLAAFATGAQEGFIYIRGEYTAQAARLERAIAQAEAHGWLGEHIAGSDWSFRLHLHQGAGAYICGEESALLESLEGRRGEPRIRPPYPSTHGYRGCPTLVDNVETLAAIPAIVANGAAWYHALGPTGTGGTKLYTLLGHVNRPGLFEAPFGLTLRQIVDDYGGGMAGGSTFNFALTGGAAGTIVPPALLDLPIDYNSGRQGVALGAGAFLICDQTVSPVALVRELLHFFEVESCGKCIPCRVGTRQARGLLDRLVAGAGRPGDLRQLAQLAELMEQASFCGLGQSAAIPIKSALLHFGSAFEAACGGSIDVEEEVYDGNHVALRE